MGLPTEVSTAHTPPMAVTITLESVTPRPSHRPRHRHRHRPRHRPGAMVSPLPTEVSTAHTPPMAVTTSESAMPRLSPGATTVSPTEVSTEDGPMSTKEELLSSGLNCNTIKNLPRRIIQLPVLWIQKKLKVQNEYLLHIATA